MPWYTYPAIEYVKSFDFSNRTIFEWGCGNSSIFWAKRCKRIISCEDSQYWFRHVMSQKRNNQDVILCADQTSYVKAIEKYGRIFDIIIVDGKYRSRCAGRAPHSLKNGGFIILDNADWYPEATWLLREQGFFQVDFSGFGPVNNYTWTTSMFFRYDSSLQKNADYAGPQPVGGLSKNADSESRQENS